MLVTNPICLLLIVPLWLAVGYCMYRLGRVVVVLLGRDKDWLLLPYIVYENKSARSDTETLLAQGAFTEGLPLHDAVKWFSDAEPVLVYRIFTQELPLYDAIRWFSALLFMIGIVLVLLVDGLFGGLNLLAVLILVFGVVLREQRWPLVHVLPTWYNRLRLQITLPDWYHLMRQWGRLLKGTRQGLSGDDHAFELWSDLVLLASGYPALEAKGKHKVRLKLADTVMYWADDADDYDDGETHATDYNDDETHTDTNSNL